MCLLIWILSVRQWTSKYENYQFHHTKQFYRVTDAYGHFTHVSSTVVVVKQTTLAWHANPGSADNELFCLHNKTNKNIYSKHGNRNTFHTVYKTLPEVVNTIKITARLCKEEAQRYLFHHLPCILKRKEGRPPSSYSGFTQLSVSSRKLGKGLGINLYELGQFRTKLTRAQYFYCLL